jgi:hypothetical protein
MEVHASASIPGFDFPPGKHTKKPTVIITDVTQPSMFGIDIWSARAKKGERA